MSRARIGLALGGVVVALAGSFALAAAASSKSSGIVKDPPARLLVTAREFSLALSRPKLEAGDAIIELYDFGEDPHDLAIQRVGGPTVFTMPEVLPGETGRIDVRLRKASRYRLWCSLQGHVELGMFASLRTSKRG